MGRVIVYKYLSMKQNTGLAKSWLTYADASLWGVKKTCNPGETLERKGEIEL